MISPAPSRLFTFHAGHTGDWRIKDLRPIKGSSLDIATHINVVDGADLEPFANIVWSLRGITSNERYVTTAEKLLLVDTQEGLGRQLSTCAALIPIRKTAAWWSLTQDERREIFEEQSKHIAIGLQYLPAIARKLHHCRDLGTDEPFDFITWFEFKASDESAFDSLLTRLRSSPEWDYVDREVDIRLQ